MNLDINNPAGSVKDAATGAEGNLGRLTVSSKLSSEEFGATRLCGIFRTGGRLSSLSVGKDHTLKYFVGYFSPHVT